MSMPIEGPKMGGVNPAMDKAKDVAGKAAKGFDAKMKELESSDPAAASNAKAAMELSISKIKQNIKE